MGSVFQSNSIAIALGLVLTGTSALSRSEICQQAVAFAATQAEAPIGILRRIALVESGSYDSQGWPWTLNIDGRGHYFETRTEAENYLLQALAAGAQSIDIGCFQINTRWHGDQFTSIAQMLDPTENALYAARYLQELYAETGSWETAVGYYHSRDPERAAAYRTRVFSKVDSPQTPPRRVQPSVESTPWLASLARKDGTSTAGSLVKLKKRDIR